MRMSWNGKNRKKTEILKKEEAVKWDVSMQTTEQAELEKYAFSIPNQAVVFTPGRGAA